MTLAELFYEARYRRKCFGPICGIMFLSFSLLSPIINIVNCMNYHVIPNKVHWCWWSSTLHSWVEGKFVEGSSGGGASGRSMVFCPSEPGSCPGMDTWLISVQDRCWSDIAERCSWAFSDRQCQKTSLFFPFFLQSTFSIFSIVTIK